MVNYYTLLGVSVSASQHEIKAAFKQLAIRYHPDKHSGDEAMEERFKEINHAYQILSNPYEKARYDLQLQYGQHTETFYQPPPPPPPRPRPTYRPRYSEPEIDWKENWRATGYAFGFTFIVAIFVMTAIGIKNYLDEKALEELLAQRREQFEQAKADYKLGNVSTALESINDLGTFMNTEEDMEHYKDQLYNSFAFEGESKFYLGDYPEAIYYYELIENYAPRQPLSIKEHLALAYKNTNQPAKSMKKFKELLISGYRSLETYIQMAEISRDYLNELEDAKRYYEIANDLAIKKYEAIYGHAYPLVLTAQLLPEEHYYLYEGLAQIYLETGDYLKAVKATIWNISIWPDSVANYVIAAKGHAAMGHRTKACYHFRVAQSLGYGEPFDIECP